MDIEEKDVYFVAVKVFLENAQGELLILKDRFGDWDLPGGRIKRDEFETPIADIIKRKIGEEIGSVVRCRLGKMEILMRHERVEATSGSPKVRIFAVGYPALLEEGEVQLGKNHVELKWVDPNNFDPDQYFTGGWLRGVKEYLLLRREIMKQFAQ